jgi:hypothetical protein
MKCKACKKRGQTWNGSPPVCAFENFDQNWNCATLNAIREIAYEGQVPMPAGVDYQYCDDQKYSTIFVDHIDEVPGLALWVSWYKSRGGTDAVWLLNYDGKPRRPTEAECLAICAAYGVTVET